MGVKAGFKKTEVGLIPIDWEVKSVEELVDVDPENIGSNTSQDYVFKYISLEDVDKGTLKNISEFAFGSAPSRARRKIKKGDILVSTVRPNLKSHLLITEEVFNWICSTGFSVLRCKSETNSTFIFNHFFASIINTQIENLITGSNYPAINSKELRALKIPLPPTKAEQTAIATALSDANTLINSLEKLIAKKRKIKKGAMHDLLTGKRRLSGFEKIKGVKHSELGFIPKDWDVKEFGQVMEGFSSGQTPYRAIAEFYKGDIPWITSGELNYNVITNTIEKISLEGMKEANLKMIRKGTFLMAITGLEAAGTRGSCAITGIEATTNQSCMALYPKKGLLITAYLYHYYVRYGNELAFKYCQGTKQQSFTGGIAKKLPIIIPPTIGEQTEIATILSGMDEEIIALETKLEKYRKVKLGMMQNLLTGKIRLM